MTSFAAADPELAVPLVASRLRAPSDISGLRERARLSSRLDRALDDRVRLTLLSAPPGYGKTCAVAGWLAARGVAHAWLSLDPADNDLARFVRYLAAALTSVRPDAGSTATALFGPAATPPLELVGATLLDEMAATDDPFALVLDDYQHVTAEPVHRLTRYLVEHGPPFVHLVLLTREDPPLPLARLRAHGRLVELRAGDLRYTVEETAAYLAGAGIPLEPELAGRLVERTEGWVAGLQLAAITLASQPDPGGMIDAFTGSQRFVFDYLADEVLTRLDEDLRLFLVRTSVADRFDSRLCQALTGREDAAALLAGAERANLFLVALDAERRWYRYHGLFADYLRAQLTDDERRELDERAADHLEARGLGPEAIGHAIAAGSIDRAARLVERVARRTFEAGELGTLLGWLDQLPAERISASAELVSLQAWALLFAGRPGDARLRADAFLATLQADGPAEARLLALRALVATVTGPDAENLARASSERLDEGDDLFRALALQAAGMAEWSRGELLAAVETWRLTFEAATRSGQPMAVFPAVTALANGLNQTGRRTESEALCRGVLADYADTRGEPRPITWWIRMPLGVLRYEANDLVEARRELERGFAAAASYGGALTVAWALGYLALVRQATGSPEAALEAVRAISRATATAGMALPAQTREIEARVRLMQGDVAAAARWADRAPPEAPPDSPLLDSLSLSRDVTIARVRLAQNRPAEAGVLLAAAGTTTAATGAVADLISIRVLEAAAAEAMGRRSEARRAVEDAVRLAAPGGYVRRFVDDGSAIVHLLPASRRLAPGFVDQVIDAFATTTSGGRSPAAGGPALWRDASGQLLETLTAREFDVLRLMARGASNAEIAEGLAVSVGTARWHVGNVLAKLAVRSRTQALVRAQRLGLV